MVPPSKEGLSVGGPGDAMQLIPSLYAQLTCLAGKSGAKPYHSVRLKIRDHRASRAIGGQASIAQRVDLRRV